MIFLLENKYFYFLVLLYNLTFSCYPNKIFEINPSKNARGSSFNNSDSLNTNHPLSINEGKGIMVNIAADGLGNTPVWGKDIDLLSKNEVIDVLKSYVESYSNSQVTTLLFNVNYQRSCFDNKVMETYWDIDNPDANIKNWPKFHWKIHKKGIDPYEVVIKHTKERGMSPWISVRMNDHHYFENPLMINKFWINHPEYRLNNQIMFDYSNIEVRNYFKLYIAEILDKYDVDGIELDWMRTHWLFKNGKNKIGSSILNEYMKEIRQLVNRKSAERGHLIKILVRVPATIEYGKSIGLDAVSWAKNGSVDIIVPTNWYWPSTFDIKIETWKNKVGLNCQIVPGIDGVYGLTNNIYLKRMSNVIEVMRGFSVSAFSRGADAVYLFNNFDLKFNQKIISSNGNVTVRNDKPLMIQEMGNLSTSLAKPRSHVFTYLDPAFDKIPENSIVLNQNTEILFKIHSGPRPNQGKYIVRVGLDYSDTILSADLAVKVNGKLSNKISDVIRDPKYVYNKTRVNQIVTAVSETSARVLQFEADIDSIIDGYNIISINNRNSKIESITWLEVYIIPFNK